jgi:hypothetical protein
MNSAGSTKVVVPGGMPTWDEKDKYFSMKRWFFVLISVFIILWLILIGWVLTTPIQDAVALPLAVGANLTIVLAPVLAAAAAVERTLESIFNTLESGWRTMVAYLGRGLRWLKNAEIEVQQARQFLADASERYNKELQGIQFGQTSVTTLTAEIQAKIDAANKLMILAQDRLNSAEGKLAAATSSDSYISAKAAASIALGLMLGVIIAAVGQLQMFAMLGIAVVPAHIDVLITGLIIGSGSYPVHSLVGILQQGKDTLDSVQGYVTRLAPQVQVTRQETNASQPSVKVGEPAQAQKSTTDLIVTKSAAE